MNTPETPVDFDVVRRNALKQGVDLQLITVLYENLSETEKAEMNSENLITHDPGTGTVLAHFRKDGGVAFPEKATGVLYLAAD